MCKSNGYGPNSSSVATLHLLWATSCSDPVNQTTISDLSCSLQQAKSGEAQYLTKCSITFVL